MRPESISFIPSNCLWLALGLPVPDGGHPRTYKWTRFQAVDNAQPVRMCARMHI